MHIIAIWLAIVMPLVAVATVACLVQLRILCEQVRELHKQVDELQFLVERHLVDQTQITYEEPPPWVVRIRNDHFEED